MYPVVEDGSHRSLNLDDDVAVSAVYDVWRGLYVDNQKGPQPIELGTDIGAGADNSAWKISKTPIGTAHDFTIQKFQDPNWVQSDGGAARIAVAPSG